MGALDKVRLLPAISVANTAPNNVRVNTVADNNLRTERVQYRVRLQVDITVAGTGIINRGSALAVIPQLGYSDGGTDKVQLDARLQRFINDQLSPSALPATRLATAGVAVSQLEEIVAVQLAAPRTVNLDETKWVEVNKMQQQRPFITPLRLITQVAQGGALVGTITNLNVTVEQIFDEMTTVAPWLSPFVEQVVADVPVANPQLRVDMRTTRYVRILAIQQDSNLGEISDAITSLTLRGDKIEIIATQVPWLDLVRAQAYENGGAQPDGYWLWDFARQGRLSTLWNPYQDTNLRFEINALPSVTVGVTQTRLNFALVQYERTAVTADPLPLNI